ncbi:uncharacterized protein EV422DRAFT_164221 [Fimicolochytrium jonesii]|uniref:uncharacterized protein n=1 Tax=Fimicolochytrium jonesii TaxID=1396493 RepID=UPI0022FEB10D|nr:uncharacterized protein EV422DRAFT_164221 [Fimicolochytrium jonesii]KAI8818770.1 hypothetical protein EV422DRAFT_164221 [Fimicolochytrium jonesii]
MPRVLAEPVLTLAFGNIQKLTSIDEADIQTIWNVFTKCKDNLENGRRLENISWRLWYRSCHGHSPLEETAPLDIPEFDPMPKQNKSPHVSPESFKCILKNAVDDSKKEADKRKNNLSLMKAAAAASVALQEQERLPKELAAATQLPPQEQQSAPVRQQQPAAIPCTHQQQSLSPPTPAQGQSIALPPAPVAAAVVATPVIAPAAQAAPQIHYVAPSPAPAAALPRTTSAGTLQPHSSYATTSQTNIQRAASAVTLQNVRTGVHNYAAPHMPEAYQQFMPRHMPPTAYQQQFVHPPQRLQSHPPPQGNGAAPQHPVTGRLQTQLLPQRGSHMQLNKLHAQAPQPNRPPLTSRQTIATDKPKVKFFISESLTPDHAAQHLPPQPAVKQQPPTALPPAAYAPRPVAPTSILDDYDAMDSDSCSESDYSSDISDSEDYSSDEDEDSDACSTYTPPPLFQKVALGDANGSPENPPTLTSRRSLLSVAIKEVSALKRAKPSQFRNLNALAKDEMDELVGAGMRDDMSESLRENLACERRMMPHNMRYARGIPTSERQALVFDEPEEYW